VTHWPSSRRSVAAATVLLLMGATAACSTGRGEIRIGVLAPRSGGLSARGRDLVDGAAMAADEINRHGGVLGRRLALTVEDDRCGPDPASRAAGRLVAARVAGVVGGVCDGAARSAAAVLGAAGRPFAVASASASDLHGSYVFLFNGTVYQEALATVHWIAYRSAQRVAVLGDSSPESRYLSKVVAGRVETRVVADSAVTGAGPRALAAKTIRARPDLVYWTGAPQAGGQLLGALRGGGYRGFFTASARSEDPAFVSAAGAAGAAGAFVTVTASPRLLPQAAAWARRFRSAHGREPGRDAMQAYDAVRALARAMTQAGTTDGAKVSAALGGLADFSTFMGQLRFAPDHTLAYDNYVIAMVKNGTFTLASKLRTN
jgi:branched-chain amino acid transport system substrate-binding protein